MYLTFCGIGITNAKLFELSAIEFNRNRVRNFLSHKRDLWIVLLFTNYNCALVILNTKSTKSSQEVTKRTIQVACFCHKTLLR